MFIADTSVAVPALMLRHEAHADVLGALADRQVRLAAHAALETYAVLTRLPGDARLAPADAARLLAERFGDPVVLPAARARGLVAHLAAREVTGGAVYDALIALTARAASASLLTRDTRASGTYARLGVAHELIV